MTTDETAARLLAWLDKLNREDPPDQLVPWVLANLRHPCTGHRQSTPERPVQASIYLAEKYVTDERDGSVALVYREGSCPKCHTTARSDGWIVKTADRPPMEGRVAR